MSKSIGVVKEDNLVVLKEGVKTFNTETTVFKPHTFYRSITLTDNDIIQTLVYGVVFGADFDEKFEFAQTRILRDFETLGIIVNGKVISKTAFGKLLDIHQYGKNNKNGFKIAYISTHPKELLYGFFPCFMGESKANTIRSAYQNVLNIIEGNMDCVDDSYVQFGNCGIPIGASPSTKLKVRDLVNKVW